MPKFNIYKIKKENESALIRKFSEVGLEQISQREVDDFDFRFFFSTSPDMVKIWWTEVYGIFFEEQERPRNQLYFGSLLISNENLCYAISLGKSHFYLRAFCDLDFGLNLAERIIDDDNVKIKN